MKPNKTKKEVKTEFPSLFSQWRLTTRAQDADSFSCFHTWLRTHHPNYVQFRSAMEPAEDLEQWFDEISGHSWTR